MSRLMATCVYAGHAVPEDIASTRQTACLGALQILRVFSKQPAGGHPRDRSARTLLSWASMT